MQRLTSASFAFLATLALAVGCKADGASEAPDVGDEEDLVGARSSYSDGDVDEEASLDQDYGKREELPPLAKPKEKCSGKGGDRECKLVDPQPAVTAAYGARKLMGRYRWGMDPRTVLAQLEKDIEDEYAERQAKTKDPTEQDKNREWKRDQVAEIARNHVRFETAAHHRWSASIIGHEFTNDDGEEMIWMKTPTLKKFYFFKEGELYKLAYAYGTQAWKGKNFNQILDEKFKTWFGVNPEQKAEFDEETQIKLIDYVQWDTADGDRVRAFDMTAVHGAVVLSLVQGDAEERYGVRLPTRQEDGEFADTVEDVLGGSDICYDEEGNMIEDAERCKELRGE